MQTLRMLALVVCCISPVKAVLAAPVTLQISAAIANVSGTYAPDLTPGMTILGAFVYDTDEANALPGADTTGSTVPGHEYSSFYEFATPPYSVHLDIPAVSGSFDNGAPVGVVVNDNLNLTAADTGGFLPAGVYDWIEILGSTTVDYCPTASCTEEEFIPASGEEWTLAIFSDTSWITDGSLIPDALPVSYQALLYGLEFDEFGKEVGVVVAPVELLTAATSSVSAPSAAWLMLVALLGMRSRRS